MSLVNAMAKFFLIRHGDKDHSDVMVGRMPGVHLTALGRTQAARLGRHMATAPLTDLLASPLERVVETVAPVAKVKKLPIQQAAAFDEIDMGRWTGLSVRTVARERSWKQFRNCSLGASIPGGETLAEAQARAVGEIIRLRAHHPSGVFAIGTHEDIVRLTVCYFIGAPLTVYERITVRTGSITVLTVEPGGATLELLDGLPPGDPRITLR